MKRVAVSVSDSAMREMVENLLKNLDVATILTSSGEGTLDLLEENPEVDLLIIDNELPHMDGKNLIKNIRKLSNHAKLPIIIASGPIQFHEVEELLELGASYFVPKPISEDRMKYYISKIL